MGRPCHHARELASGVGIALAVLLFTLGQLGGRVVRRTVTLAHEYCKQVRSPAARALLAAHGARTGIVELQYGLSFGTADQLYSAFEPEFAAREYLVLDFRRA